MALEHSGLRARPATTIRQEEESRSHTIADAGERVTLMAMGGEKKWKVLYFDDNALALQATTFAFAETEMELSTASNFEELQSRLDAGAYDLVLLDVEVPEVFGDDVGSVLRGSRGLETPIYLYSSLPEAELEERAKDAGLDGFICKDVGMEGLIEAVLARLQVKS